MPVHNIQTIKLFITEHTYLFLAETELLLHEQKGCLQESY